MSVLQDLAGADERANNLTWDVQVRCVLSPWGRVQGRAVERRHGLFAHSAMRPWWPAEAVSAWSERRHSHCRLDCKVRDGTQRKCPGQTCTYPLILRPSRRSGK